MKVPERLEEWTFLAIKNLLEAGVFELDVFDFKECLPLPVDDKGKHRLRKSIAAFANSGGGFLLFGIKDDRTLSPNERLVGVPSDKDFPQEFGSYPAACQPSVEWRPLTIPIKIGVDRFIHVIEILSTWKKPHVVFRDGAYFFVKRTNKGDEEMSFLEVKSAFQEAEFRRSGLSLLVSELGHMRSVAESMINEARKINDLRASPDQPWAWSCRYSTMLLDVVLGNVFSFLAADPALWALLCTVREKARSSNALSEAISSAVYFRISQRVEISDTKVRQLVTFAGDIVEATKEAEERISKL